MRHTDCGITLRTDDKTRGLLKEVSGVKGLKGRRGESVWDIGFLRKRSRHGTAFEG